MIKMQAKIFVSSHVDVSTNLIGLINLNKQKVFEIANQIPIMFETLL